MKNTRKLLFALVLSVVLLATPLLGHIVPPEKLHPVTESYRRLVFVLNLNPVPWDLVRDDLEVVQGTGADRESSNALQAGLTTESAEERLAATRSLFASATKSVAEQLIAALDEGKATLAEHSRASQALELARQLWASFEHEVRATDARAFRRLGGSWLAMSSALGTPGVLGLGTVPADVELFTTEADELIAYVREHFVSPQTRPSAPLAPLPVLSETFDPKATVPVRLPPGHDINKQLPRPRQVLNMAERGVDEAETILIALGDMAFDSSFIFGEPARSLAISCNTCHNKSITNPGLFIPGLSARPGGMDVSNSFFAPHANNGHFDHLDTPDLRGIRFTQPYGRNGRFPSLREFVRNVIVNEFNGSEPGPLLLDGMIAYMLEFDFLSNPLLLADGRLRPEAGDQALRGEALFRRSFGAMGDRSCATCHVPSDHFLDRKSHDIGTVHGTAEDSRDRALDTPTLLSSKYTAPYFHDGRAATLEAVVAWFEERYGLGLSASEQSDLTTYLETIGDGVDGYEDTMFTLSAELEEFSFFLSAFEFLEARGRRDLIGTTFETVALELRAHKWDVQDQSYLPVLEDLAVLMDEAIEANRRGDEEAVRDRVSAYRELYQENAEVLQ